MKSTPHEEPPRSAIHAILHELGPNRREALNEQIAQAVKAALEHEGKSKVTLNLDFTPNVEKACVEVDATIGLSVPKVSGGSARFFADGEPGKWTGEIHAPDERRSSKRSELASVTPIKENAR